MKALTDTLEARTAREITTARRPQAEANRAAFRYAGRMVSALREYFRASGDVCARRWARSGEEVSMNDSCESTRMDHDGRVSTAHLDGMREALRILDGLRMGCLATGPDDPHLLGIGLAVYAIRGALRAKGVPVAGDRPGLLPARRRLRPYARSLRDASPLCLQTRRA